MILTNPSGRPSQQAMLEDNLPKTCQLSTESKVIYYSRKVLVSCLPRYSADARLARGNMTSIVTTATTTQLGIPVLVARGSGTLCVVTQPAGHPPLQLHARTTVGEK